MLHGVTDRDSAVLRFDAQGQLTWQRILPNAAGAFEGTTSISSTASGDLLVAGNLDQPGPQNKAFVARFSPSGEIDGCQPLHASLAFEDIPWSWDPVAVVPTVLPNAGANPQPMSAAPPSSTESLCLGASAGIETYCTALVNSTGNAARIAAVGTPSISANNLILVVDNLPPSQPGIFIAGPTQTNIPFGAGILCIAPAGLQRFSQVSNSQNGHLFTFVDLASSAPGGLNVIPGQSFHYQRWNRDGALGTVTFSDAIAVAYLP